MESSDYKISLDLMHMSAPVSLSCRQGDTGRRICINLTQDGTPYNIAPGCYAVFAGKKPDDKVLWNGCTIDGNTIIYELTDQTLAVTGWVPVQILLYGSNGKRLASPDFVLLVDEPLVRDAAVVAESANEITALTQLIGEATALMEEMRDFTDGKSAYEIAQENGFEGTEAEWLESLKGAQGPAGPKGETGPQGPKGETGAAGQNGTDGKDGGYYTPEVTQPTEDTMQVAFTPSKAGMPAVQPATVKLPVGSGSGSSPNVNPVPKTDDMTQPVGIDADGRLWVAPIGGGSSGGGTDEPDTPVVTTHGIVWDLVNVSSSNAVASVNDGASLTAVLTALEGYNLGDVTVTMGGEVLTGVWNADTATVTIASVTGDVIISCAGVVESTGPVDTTAVIVTEGQTYDYLNGTNLVNSPGYGITKVYEFSYDIDALKASPKYDAANDYLTGPAMGGFIVSITNTNHVANGLPTTNSNKHRLTADGVYVSLLSNPASGGKASITQKNSALLNASVVGVEFSIPLADIDDAYAYWCEPNSAACPTVFPNGVRNGDIVFAGKNTEYYGMANIDGTMAGGASTADILSFDDDIAQNYAVATTSIMGEDLATDTNTAYGLSSDFAAVIDEVKAAWMLEYGGDYRKIPVIISTDQHGRTNAGIFNMIGKAFSMHDISKVMNLGDTLATDWYDADEAHPLLSNAELEAWCKSTKAIPFSKQLNVFGNHDCCYGNYEDDGNPIGTRYPDSKAHLYQYFRNIYARRTNNHGWFSVKDDAFNVKYVVYSLYQWPNGLGNGNAIHTEQMEWFINELKADDGYDIVIVAHEPFNLNCTTANYPTNGTLQEATWQRGIALESVINARMNKTSGTTTDGSGASHTFDFSGCTSELLCSLHGHTHEDQYAYTEGGMLQNSFDWFANNTFFMVLIDRVNRQLNVWKIDAVDSVPAYINYQIPLDKPTA